MPLILIACAANDRRQTPGYVGREMAGRTLAFIPPDTAQIEAGNPADIWACFARERSYSARAILSQEFTDAFMAGLDRYVDFVKPVLAAPGAPLPADKNAPAKPTEPIALAGTPADSAAAASKDTGDTWIAPPDTAAPVKTAAAPPDTGFITYHRAATGTLPSYDYVFPAQGRLAARGLNADLALVVGRLKSMSAKLEIVAPKSGGAIQQPFMVLEGQYLIWDYAAQKPVGYGRFRSQVDYRGEPETRDWMQAFDKAVKKVIEASPFRGPKWFRA